MKISGYPQHASIREDSIDSSSGVVEGILLHVRPLFSRVFFYICERN